MTQELWTAVDRYLSEQLAPDDPALTSALAASDAAGMPSIHVTPTQGKLLHLLALTVQARRILEVGTLAGYSTIWMARALPADGRLITLEFEPKHADVARANIARAGLSDRVELRLGKALDTLPKIHAEGLGPFDLSFIDADKASNPEYFGWALRMSRRGALIVVDNVVREGAVLDAKTDDPSTVGVRRLIAQMAAEPRVLSTALQTVGAKGHDGLAIALVTTDP